MPDPIRTFLDSLRSTGEEWYELLLRKPLFFLGQKGLQGRSMFTDLPLRQKATIYAGVLWVIPIAMVDPYISLYMVHLGLSETEVGTYRSLMNLLRPLALFAGGYFSDTWGRKKTLIAFDILSWGGYCLCLALASNKWWCVAALFFMATNSGSAIPYACLLAEGVSSKKRAVVYSVLQIVNMAPALLFFPLLGGLWESQRGLLPSNHEMYWLETALIALGIGLRWRYLPESGVYEQSASSWFHAFRNGLGQYQEAFLNFFKKPGSRIFLLSKLIDEWVLLVWGTTYASLYYVQRLGLKDSYLSVLSQSSAYVSFLVLFLFAPSFSEGRLSKLLGLDQLFGLAAFALLWWTPSGGSGVLLLCLLSAGLGAIGSVLYGSINSAIWMNWMEERERAKVVATSSGVIYLGLTTGSFGAYLYGHVSPAFMLGFLMVLRAVNFLLLRLVSNRLSKPASGADG